MGPSQFHRYPFRSSDTTDPMFVCRPSPISLALLNIIPQPFDHLLAIVATARQDRPIYFSFERADYFPRRIFFHYGARLLRPPTNAFVSSALFSREPGYYLSIYRYTYMHLSRTRRGESIFLLSFQSCRAPFRSFHSRTGSSINHRISLTPSSSSFVARLQTSILRSRAC